MRIYIGGEKRGLGGRGGGVPVVQQTGKALSPGEKKKRKEKHNKGRYIFFIKAITCVFFFLFSLAVY